ncbi:MAG: Type 1 glutamine amidotransferase-like domain-containing protein [Clostridia bacterium]|nr:Type 1 glutamine amidotransferase-like domain-containing protein [Clostridia bacterium]
MLILSSCDFRNDIAKCIIVDNLPKAIGDCRVLFIPNEKATHESIVSGKYHRRLEEFGFCADNVAVFDHTCPDAFRNLDIDLIYISGGNTFATLQKLRDTGFDKDIIRYVQNGVCYLGGSAGAHIASKSVAHVAAFDDVPNGMTDFSGLSLFDGVLICHYTSEREELYAKLKSESIHPVYVLTDDDVMIE